MAQKKKILFYSILSTGHINLCSSIGTVLLNNYPNELEIYFITDNVFKEKISKKDARFKFAVFDYNNKQDEARVQDMLMQLEQFIELPVVERVAKSYDIFIYDPTSEEVDIKAEKLIREIKPDLVLCDDFWVFPSIIGSGVKYGFVASTSPSIFNIDGYPMFASDAGVNEKEKIAEFKHGFSECRRKCVDQLYKRFKERGFKYEGRFPIDAPLSDDFPTIYSYPEELDYFSEETKSEYNLWQIDGAILKNQIPKPFELPSDFASLPGKLIYISLGTCFSVYINRFQKLIDMLETLPYKYIVSKGPDGEKLKFPSNKFIGENHVDQLAVLQIVDGMITHGGNNTLCECFYFGLPSIVFGIFGDQINNAKRLEETGYGCSIDLTNYNQEILASKLDKILNDEIMKSKLKKASERIQRDDQISSIGSKFMQLFNKL